MHKNEKKNEKKNEQKHEQKHEQTQLYISVVCMYIHQYMYAYNLLIVLVYFCVYIKNEIIEKTSIESSSSSIQPPQPSSSPLPRVPRSPKEQERVSKTKSDTVDNKNESLQSDTQQPNNGPHIKQLPPMPTINYLLLQILFKHLHGLLSFQEHTKMNLSNLAIVFSPTLMRPPGNGMFFT